jgi:hypothetical protein
MSILHIFKRNSKDFLFLQIFHWNIFVFYIHCVSQTLFWIYTIPVLCSWGLESDCGLGIWVVWGFIFFLRSTRKTLYVYTKWGTQCQRCLTHIFVKMALFAPNGFLVTRIMLLPETVKCGIGASGTERLELGFDQFLVVSRSSEENYSNF